MKQQKKDKLCDFYCTIKWSLNVKMLKNSITCIQHYVLIYIYLLFFIVFYHFYLYVAVAILIEYNELKPAFL